jgi:hypothetical protein
MNWIFMKDGKYSYPADNRVSDCLGLQHRLFVLTFNGRLCHSPIHKEQQRDRVADVCTGTGIRGIDFANGHHESQVIGVDFTSYRKMYSSKLNDLEEPWTVSYESDFICGRIMVTGLAIFFGVNFQ